MYEWTVIQDKGNGQHLATIETSAGFAMRAFDGLDEPTRAAAELWCRQVASFERACDTLAVEQGIAAQAVA